MTNNKTPNNLVQGYRTNPIGSFEADWINYNQPFSSGNMYSNLADLRRFSQAVFSGELFSRKLLEKLKSDNAGKYGYGWGIRRVDSLFIYGHIGAMNGFVGGINYLPKEDLFIGYLTNDDNTPRYTISRDLTKLALESKVTVPENKKYRNLSKKESKLYHGNYLIKTGDTLMIFESNDHLFMKETGQEAHRLFCFGNNKFDSEKLEFDVVFQDSLNDSFGFLTFQKNKSNFLKATRIK